ncbi:MAG TPA: hypothetical protein VL354_16255 [Spirochaetia bacterium]|nr:hypothetical protein [Spirochaetia bacterium]
MSEQEARKVFSHVFALAKVFGGNVRKMCADRGVPEPFVRKLLDEQDKWDRGLQKFDWDGSIKRAAS